MAFINYEIHNFCAYCDHRFLKELGIMCPNCNRRARTDPRLTKYKTFNRN
jgi:DNA-directed RNA polymerase subunit RPC12/RpoP